MDDNSNRATAGFEQILQMASLQVCMVSIRQAIWLLRKRQQIHTRRKHKTRKSLGLATGLQVCNGNGNFSFLLFPWKFRGNGKGRNVFENEKGNGREREIDSKTQLERE